MSVKNNHAQYMYICLHVVCSFIFYVYKYSHRYWTHFPVKILNYCWDTSDQILCDLYIYCCVYVLLFWDTCEILRRYDPDLCRNCRKEGAVNIFWQQEGAYESFIIWCIAHQMHYVILSLSQSHVNDLSSTIINNNQCSKQHI